MVLGSRLEVPRACRFAVRAVPLCKTTVAIEEEEMRIPSEFAISANGGQPHQRSCGEKVRAERHVSGPGLTPPHASSPTILPELLPLGVGSWELGPGLGLGSWPLGVNWELEVAALGIDTGREASLPPQRGGIECLETITKGQCLEGAFSVEQGGQLGATAER